MAVQRSCYQDLSRKLVISFDIGTTYSGISYCLLDPGKVPQIQGVTRFPAQEHLGGSFKIPSLIYYDKQGRMTAAGAEALLETNIQKAEKENWYKLRWWKLLLAPRELVAGVDKSSVPKLPPGKSIVDVFADFLAYLLNCVKQYVSDAHASGGLLWSSVKSGIQFVLTHPNGWEGAQQATMRKAAINAGLVPDSEDGHSRITFVTEGEASFNYCANNSQAADAFQKGQSILIIDAGGGTVDISAYAVTTLSPLSVDELFSPECLLQGSEFVTFRAGDCIKKKLKSSKFDTPGDFANMVDHFDGYVKRIFADKEDSVRIKFGTLRDNDPVRDISGGQLRLSGGEVASFFKESIDAIAVTVDKHFGNLVCESTNVFLVGGFAASPWLFEQLQEKFRLRGLKLSRPEGQTGKAVADGAIFFYLHRSVMSRIAKYTYGSPCRRVYDSSKRTHRIRAHKSVEGISGDMELDDAFAPILHKERIGVRVSATEEFSVPLSFKQSPPSSQISTDITRYRGNDSSPHWMDDEPELFTSLCRINADISSVPKTIKRNRKGVEYSVQNAHVVLLFGSTELKAQLCWFHDGQEKRSAAKVVYDDED